VEIIVVDDGSTDDSGQILRKLSDEVSDLKCYFLGENHGVNHAVNYGLERARGRYFHGASANDYPEPHFLEKTTKLLDLHSAAAFCWTESFLYNVEQDRIDLCPTFWDSCPRYFAPFEFALNLRKAGIANQTVVARTELIREAGGFDAKYRWHSDYYLWLKLAFRHGACYEPTHCKTFTIDPASYGLHGRSRKSEEMEVLGRMLDDVKRSENRDIFPYFSLGCAFAHVGEDMMRYLCLNPDKLDSETMFLVSGICSGIWNSLDYHKGQLARQNSQIGREIARIASEQRIKFEADGDSGSVHEVNKAWWLARPEDARAREAYAGSLTVLGKREEARRELEFAHRLSPTDSELIRSLLVFGLANSDELLCRRAERRWIINGGAECDLNLLKADALSAAGFIKLAVIQYGNAYDSAISESEKNRVLVEAEAKLPTEIYARFRGRYGA
jgi:glycosyltransferase involved in cell wall biosynthesis